MDAGHSRIPWRNEELVIDEIVSTQPEIGPKMPDGGYGWIVFLATLFFHICIPSLIVSFGIFLATERVLIEYEDEPFLWDDRFMYTPLLFIATWTFIDPVSRLLISTSTWPRLVASSGVCLTCAGLLFLWMGKAGYGQLTFYPLAGVISGAGASLIIAQCEIILAQYFRLKHAILAYITEAVTAIGFVVAPIIIGLHIAETKFLHIILWYEAFVIQGIFFALTFKKPAYLKSKQSTTHNYILTNPDEEEDIFSKNSRELQIKRQDRQGNSVTIEKHEISNGLQADVSEAAGSSSSPTTNWETFDEEPGNGHLYQRIQDNSEQDDENTVTENNNTQRHWETFHDDEHKPIPVVKNKYLEKSFLNTEDSNIPSNTTGGPSPLFSDTPVNNNTTYSYDALEQDPVTPATQVVFMPTDSISGSKFSSLGLLRQPTFYKSLLTVVTTKFSIYVFYTLLPVYIFEELTDLKVRELCSLIGLLSISNLLFSAVSYWLHVDKKRRPICMWILCWLGSFGYFMISDSNTKSVLIFGAVPITLSISTLEYVGMPILGLTLRGETNKEFNLISIMCGCAFSFFLFINSSVKNCFRFMALLHFFTGAIWFTNYVYKKIK